MTDKEQINCKYKFQNKEKFGGKPYCLCHNELCEDYHNLLDIINKARGNYEE